ncbi:MAG TPA: T9SS type A sorting domain-containing protein [Chitinophagales bacterium]|nr:T9SS type A sorting domain-containing protein [Chitinophagales bacterium]
MNKSLIIISFVIFWYHSLGQSIVFEKYFSVADFPGAIIQNSSGEYYTASFEINFHQPNEESLLTKFDKHGDILWSTLIYDSSIHLMPRDLITLGDDDVFLLATISNETYDTSRVVLINLDSSGNIKWSRSYFNNVMMDALKMELANVAISGVEKNIIRITCCTVQLGQYSNAKANILEVDLNGNILWGKQYKLNYGGNFIVRTHSRSDGGFYGMEGIYANGICMFSADSFGNILWRKCFRLGTYLEAGDFCISRDGDLVGAANVTLPNNPVWLDLELPCIFRMSSTGNMKFFKYFPPPVSNVEETYSGNIFESWDGNFFVEIEGLTVYPFSNSAELVVKLDSGANVLSTKIYEKDLYLYYCNHLTQTRDSGFAGLAAVSFSQYNDNAIFKVDKYGNTNCADDSVDLFFSDTSWYSFPAPVTVIQDFQSDTLSLLAEQVSVDEFTICEDDSFQTPLTGIENQTVQESQLIIFPSLAHSVITVLGEKTLESLRVFSSDGKLMHQINHLHQARLDLDVSDWSNGMYFIAAFSGEKIYRNKFIVNR